MRSLKLKSSLNLLLVILFTLTVLSCAKVQIKDAEWCGDMGTSGASCFHTLTNEQRDVPKNQWDAERFGMLCTKSQSFADQKVAIEQLCHQTKDCDYQTQQKIEAFFNRLEYVRAASHRSDPSSQE